MDKQTEEKKIKNQVILKSKKKCVFLQPLPMPGVLTLPQATRQLGMELQHTGMGWIQLNAQAAGSCVPMTSLAAIHPWDKTNITFITKENLCWAPQNGAGAPGWTMEQGKGRQGHSQSPKIPSSQYKNNCIGKI